MAKKPEWAGGGKGNVPHEGIQEARSSGSVRGAPHGYFRDRDRDAVRHYYADEFRAGKGCPPGLAKKRNGCLPPGQAKKRWGYGRALPGDLEYHGLPPRLLSQLPPPPGAHRYVRIASDILLITIGTQVVVDVIEDLGELLR